MYLKIGFIGCGRWAQQTYLPFLKNNSSLELVALSGSSRTENGVALASKLGFTQFYDDWKKMLAKEKLDLVFITTPHTLHYEQIKGCLENNIHVHVDKPPVLHFDQATELLKLANEKKLVVSVHSQRRFYEEYKSVKSLIEKGALGGIQFVQGDFGQQLFDDFRGSWRSNPELSGGGIMIDSGYHLLDSILFMLGKVEPKSVVMLSNRGEFQSDTFSTLSCQLETDCLITLNVIRGLPQNVATERVQIVGTKGWVLISRDRRNGKTNLTFEVYDVDGNQTNFLSEEVLVVDRVAPLHNLISALSKERNVDSSLEQSLTTVQILEAGYKSLKTNQLVQLRA